MKLLYTAKAHATGGREGRVRSSDGHVDAKLAPPAELGGPGDESTNPEQLFACGYGACFLGALKVVAAPHKLRTSTFTVDCHVTLSQDEEGGFLIGAELHCTLPDIESDQAWALVERAQEVCPYSRATRENIDVKLFVSDVQPAGV